MLQIKICLCRAIHGTFYFLLRGLTGLKLAEIQLD
jgi:hypothetical protein